MWDRIRQVTLDHSRFVITTHPSPDGDAIGSELALAEFLRDMGKSVRVVNADRAPRNYRFLSGYDEILLLASEEAEQWLASVDTAFILDISTWARLGALGDLLNERAITSICIDHHPMPEAIVDAGGGGGGEGAGHERGGTHGAGPAGEERATRLYAVDVGAAATGELVYDLIMAMGGTLSRTQAEAIYVAILTDTGSFRFSNTSGRIHRVAAHLLELGIDPERIYDCVYGGSSMARLQLLGRALSAVEVCCDGRIACVVVTRQMLEETGARPDETEGLVDLARLLEGVELSLCFIEQEDGRVRLSFRSRGRVRVSGLARQFGGGGHDYASGALPEGRLRGIVEDVLEEACRLVRGADGERKGCEGESR